MDQQFLIELIGYLGSFLVVVSMLMTSIKKLRIVNTIGSVIFTTYALIIHSYPTAFMNFCLVAINVYKLYRIKKDSPHYHVYESNGKDASLHYLTDYYKEDILHFFPDTDLEAVKDCNFIYIVVCDTAPAGFLIGNRIQADTIDVIVDYSTPKYRDTSVGSYLYQELAKNGIRKLQFCVSSVDHENYMKKMGFTQTVDGFVKEL
ncbi:MAG: YgjV family protein [Lachnospiraceae bacterium]|nr:YgjV family protein [Lachnospiraceae bacterium]